MVKIALRAAIQIVFSTEWFQKPSFLFVYIAPVTSNFFPRIRRVWFGQINWIVKFVVRLYVSTVIIWRYDSNG